MKFGEFVLGKGVIDENQLNTALKITPFRKQKIGRLMVELGFFDQKSLDSLLKQFFNSDCPFSFKDLQRFCINKKILHGALLIEQSDQNIQYVSNIFSDLLIKKLESFHNSKIRLYQVSDKIMQLLLGKKSDDYDSNEIVVTAELTPDDKLKAKDPFSKLIAQCLQEACNFKCSDIHFEPFEDRYLIRFRIHGKLQDWKTIQKDHIEPITSKLKWILGLDLAVVSQPQDSRASFVTLGCDMRVNSMPTASGSEKVVVRVQYQDENLSLEQIGLDSEKIQVLRRNINKKEGLIVISGPTGSGKTTTLYALLEEMDRQGKNISTLENPVEKKLERIVQSNVTNEKDFHNFQRALMRQDPDIILLGEIRDPETADLSMKLASTGHLVLSTVHANGAKEVIDRLINLGIDQYSIQTNLRLSVAQRLLRRICHHCRQKSDLGFKANHKGCSECKGGIIGRVAIIEYLEKQDLIDNKTPTTLSLEAKKLVQKGIVDISELSSFA